MEADLTEFVIGPDESALIFSADGAARVVVPPGVNGSGPANDGAVWAGRCAVFIGMPDLVAIADRRLREDDVG